jgi:prepilin-type processing-associated H-X9-DG protein
VFICGIIVDGSDITPYSLFVERGGRLPYGYWDGSVPIGSGYNGDKAGDWSLLLAHALDSKQPTNYNAYSAFMQSLEIANAGGRGLFICPEAREIASASLYESYSAHPRLVPNLQDTDQYAVTVLGQAGARYVPYRISHIKRSSEIILFFDGAATSGSNSGGSGNSGAWSANVVGGLLDAGALSGTQYGGGSATTYLTDDYSKVSSSFNSGNSCDLTPKSAALADINKDSDGNWGNIRFRHNKNTQANALFVDGHADTFSWKSLRVMDLRRKNVNVNP